MNEFLVDTHLLLWSTSEVGHLSPRASFILNNPGNKLFFSVISLWETAIKHAKRQDDFPFHPLVLRQALIDGGFFELSLTSAHVLGVADLPPIHKDPFDRMLIAQAVVENITLLTADATIARYPGRIEQV